LQLMKNLLKPLMMMMMTKWTPNLLQTFSQGWQLICAQFMSEFNCIFYHFILLLIISRTYFCSLLLSISSIWNHLLWQLSTQVHCANYFPQKMLKLILLSQLIVNKLKLIFICV
jgi:hypothetical protein